MVTNTNEGMSAHGTLIAVSPDPLWPPQTPVGGAVTFVTIAQLRDITPPPKTRNVIELTNQNDGDDTAVVGVRRKGEMQFGINYVPDNLTHDQTIGVNKDWQDGLRKIFRLTYPDGTQWMFSGFYTNISEAAPVDDALTADITVKPTGAHKWVAHA